jgi:hypothetical protein
VAVLCLFVPIPLPSLLLWPLGEWVLAPWVRLTDRFVKAKLSVMTVVTISSAAQRLGVSVRQVQYLVAQGALQQVARGVIDESSVERHVAVRGGSHRRAWSEATAWSAVSLLSGGDAEQLAESQRSRLKNRLRHLRAAELAERARGRALVTRYRGHSSANQYLRSELVSATEPAGRFGLAEATGIDGYLGVEDLDKVVSRHGLIRDDDGRVTLRATTLDLDVVRDLVERSVVLGAVDLAESLDIRERRVGLDAIDRALTAFRD